MQPVEEKKSFSIRKRIHHANHALRGVGIFLRGTHAAWLHLFFSALAIYLGFILHISYSEWAIVLLTMGVVFISEAVNTAIELNVDMHSPGYSPAARDTKDVAAGAVLIAILFAGIVGMIIFLPKVFVLFH